MRGLCTPSELLALTEQDLEAVRGIPNQVPFFHICKKHGFGWYDAVSVDDPIDPGGGFCTRHEICPILPAEH